MPRPRLHRPKVRSAGAGAGADQRRQRPCLRSRLLSLLAAGLLAGAATGCRLTAASAGGDALADDVQRWSTMLHSRATAGGGWAQLEQSARPRLESVREALRHGRRLLALQRLAEARVDLGAKAYVRELPAAQRQTAAAFETEWARLGGPLRAELGPASAGALSGVRPAAARAIGEAALLQVRAYYQASLEYGRNTMPANGYFYLGTAQALQQLVAFCRTVGEGFPDRRQPELRNLDSEIDGLETEVLAAYRPPQALARHRDFIAVGSLLKEARELDAAGLRHGALLRYLQAATAARPLRPAAPPPDPRALERRLRELDARLAADRLDHSIGRLYLEIAQTHLEAAAGAPGAPGAGIATAAAILDDVLPRYLAALGPAPPVAPRPVPAVTVTLVRWPYT